MDPSGRFVYTANLTSNDVSVFALDAGSGALTAGTAVGVGTGPRGITVDPSGRFAYTANRTSDNLTFLTINQATGALTSVATVAAGDGPFAIGITPKQAASTPDSPLAHFLPWLSRWASSAAAL